MLQASESFRKLPLGCFGHVRTPGNALLICGSEFRVRDYDEGSVIWAPVKYYRSLKCLQHPIHVEPYQTAFFPY